jgi:hypothetical protein
LEEFKKQTGIANHDENVAEYQSDLEFHMMVAYMNWKERKQK